MEQKPHIEYDPYDFGNQGIWSTETLNQHAKNLYWEKETAQNPRRAKEFDRELGHVAFELWYRHHRMNKEIET